MNIFTSEDWQNDTSQKGGTDFRLYLPHKRNFLLLEKHHTKNILDSSVKGLGHPSVWFLCFYGQVYLENLWVRKLEKMQKRKLQSSVMDTK